MIIKGGFVHYDTPIGVLCLESYFAKPAGHVRNPLTFSFPIVCHVVRDVDVPRLLFNPEPELLHPFIEGVRQLEKDGVKAIVGSCGFMARFQQELASAVSIPVISSSLMQLPLLKLIHGSNSRIGILTASENALTPAHFAQTGCVMEDYIILGMEAYPTFWKTIITREYKDMDMAAMEQDICQAAASLHKEHDLAALVLECTDLSAFSHAIQQQIQIPVYDINSLVEYAARSVMRRPYRQHFS